MYDEPKVKSLAKALRVLECFTAKTPELGITEISDQLGLCKSNVHNIVSTFEQSGYLERDERTSKYRLGLKVLELSYIINFNLGLHKVLKPFMQALADEVGETVFFAIPNEGRIIYLEGAYPVSSLAVRSILGEQAEMYCTSLGKAILAFLPPGEASRAMSRQSLRSFTAQTITDIASLTRELDRIRRQGYSIDNMEHEHGVCCVGVPVFDRNGNLVGAMSITGPSPRFEKEAIQNYAAKLIMIAQQISVRL